MSEAQDAPPPEIDRTDADRVNAALRACRAVVEGFGFPPHRQSLVFANLLVLSIVSLVPEEAEAEALEAMVKDLRAMLPLHRAQLQRWATREPMQ